MLENLSNIWWPGWSAGLHHPDFVAMAEFQDTELGEM